MTADAILSMTPGELFSGSKDDISHQFKTYAKLWHPDRNKDPEAINVFQHLKRSMDVVLGKSNDHRLTLTRLDGTKFNLDYVRVHEVGFGKIYVSKSSISYLINKKFSKLAEPAAKRKWSYINDSIKKEMTRFLPIPVKVEETTDGWFMAYRRKSSQVLARDLLDYNKLTGTPVEPLSVMWMISGLLNIASYLDVHKVSHNAINPNFLLFDLEDHSVSLTGPAIFAVPFGFRPKAVPVKTLDLFPRIRVETFKAENSLIDLTLIRALALQLIGRKNSPSIRTDDALPIGLRTWLLSSAPSHAVTDYAVWESKRGKRKFHKYGITAKDVYSRLRE